MKLVIATILFFAATASAFAPSIPSTRSIVATSTSTTTKIMGGEDDEEEGGLDLDLGEMFDM